MALSAINWHLDRYKQKLREMHGDVDFVDAFRRCLVGFTDISLTATQVKALNTTPVVLVAAPGAGFAILVTEVFTSLVFNAAAYACNASGAALKYKADASGATVGISLTQAYIQAASGTNVLHVRASATALAPDVNQPVVIQAVSSDPTTGDSIIKIRTYFKVVAAPLPTY